MSTVPNPKEESTSHSRVTSACPSSPAHPPKATALSSLVSSATAQIPALISLPTTCVPVQKGKRGGEVPVVLLPWCSGQVLQSPCIPSPPQHMHNSLISPGWCGRWDVCRPAAVYSFLRSRGHREIGCLFLSSVSYLMHCPSYKLDHKLTIGSSRLQSTKIDGTIVGW